MGQIVQGTVLASSDAQPQDAHPDLVDLLKGAFAHPAGPRERVPVGQQAANVWRGYWSIPAVVRAWMLATEYDESIAGLKAAGDHAKAAVIQKEQLAEAEKRRTRFQVVAREVAFLVLPAALSITGFWAVVLFGVLAAIGFWIYTLKVLKAAVVQRLVEMAAVAVGLWLPAWGLRSWLAGAAAPVLEWSPVYLLLPALPVLALWAGATAWAVRAARYDGTVADDLGVAAVSVTPVETEPEPGTDGAIIKAIASSEAKLAKDAVLSVVGLGVVQLAGGRVYQVTVDTGGPTAQPIIDAIDDIASRLGLDTSRCFAERSPGMGRRVTVTGVVVDPFQEPSKSPLLDLPEVNIWDGIPFGWNVYGQRETLQLVYRNYLVGGLPDMGKSTTGNPVLAAYCLSKYSRRWIIDGGQVDTAAIHRAGLAHRWVANDPEAALGVMRELNAYADERQQMLDDFGADHPGYGKKVTPEMCEHFKIGPDVLWWDEFASHMNCPDRKLAKELRTLADSVLQRIRKLAISAVLSTQSPSAIAMNTDGRDVISDRFALPCSTPQMSDKILGQGSASNGHNAARLPRRPGVGYLSTSEGTRIARADYLDEVELAGIYRRAVVLQDAAGVRAPEKQAPALLVAALHLIRAVGGESMRSAELVGRLAASGHDLPEGIRGQQLLAVEMAKYDVRPVQQWSDGGKSHYLLAEVEKALKRFGHAA